jgi:hypothetical protein
MGTEQQAEAREGLLNQVDGLQNGAAHQNGRAPSPNPQRVCLLTQQQLDSAAGSAAATAALLLLLLLLLLVQWGVHP